MTGLLRRITALTLVVSISGLAVPLPAQAAMLATQNALVSADKARIGAFLDRSDVREQLQARGVDAADAKARVAALSDEEAQQLAQRIDQLPAGGDAAGAIIGAALIVFLVLLLTDLLGYTHVFPFVKPMRR
jgi:hypothetical protein